MLNRKKIEAALMALASKEGLVLNGQDKLEHDCALSPLIIMFVQNIIDDLRDEMARKIFEAES